jgi:L-lactate dehydrogenase complex protein LldG
MTAGREEVLSRIRTAIGPTRSAIDVPRDYRQADGDSGDLDLLVDRLVDYRAHVTRVDQAGVPDAIAERLTTRGVSSLLVPEGVPLAWLGQLSGVPLLRDDPPLSAHELDEVSSVLTGCALAIAETGTIVLDHGPGQGRRALTLVPDHHVVVVHANQVVRGIVEAVATVTPRRPMTWISGPSATSDIELQRVEGVHGPRRLDVILAQ